MSAFSSTWGQRERESKCGGGTEIQLSNCQWGTVALALTVTQNSKLLYLLSSSATGFHQAQHKNCTPAAGLKAQPLGWSQNRIAACLWSQSSDICACLNYSELHILAVFSRLYAHTHKSLQTLWAPCVSGPWCRLLSILWYFFAGFSPFPPQSDLWFRSYHYLFAIPTHHVSSCMVAGPSDSSRWYSKPWLKSRNCLTVLLQYYLRTKNVPQPSKTPDFADPIIIFAVLNHPAVCPLAHALFLTARHSLAKQAVAWLCWKGKAPTLTRFTRCIFHPSSESAPAGVHEEWGCFHLTLVYLTFQTLRQNFVCAVLCACQT